MQWRFTEKLELAVLINNEPPNIAVSRSGVNHGTSKKALIKGLEAGIRE